MQDHNIDINEQQYRDIDAMSYSLLSSVSRTGYKSLTEVFKPNVSTKFGVLVESLLFDDYVEDDYYIIDEGA